MQYLQQTYLMTRRQCSEVVPSVVAALHGVAGRHCAGVELRDWRGEPGDHGGQTPAVTQSPATGH